MRDFTLSTYRTLLKTLLHAGYVPMSYEQYCMESSLPTRYVIVRHDVDKKPCNSLDIARIEKELGICASYYFRIVPDSNDPDIIRAIAALGHEIGYHYEDMALADGDTDRAYAHFLSSLSYFRTFYPIRTICMHGAPTNRWDGRLLWQKYDYRAVGIIGEPYMDMDFSDVFYLTDTGRCWDGYRVSVRDKIPRFQEEWVEKGWSYHTTSDLIVAIEKMVFPPHVMITTHPQRWTDNKPAWYSELIKQTIKNRIKHCLIYAQTNFH